MLRYLEKAPQFARARRLVARIANGVAGAALKMQRLANGQAKESAGRWAEMAQDLMSMVGTLIGEPIYDVTRRQRIAAYFAVRVARRTQALKVLFDAGWHLEATPLVRAAYEDWVSIAYILLRPGTKRIAAFEDAQAIFEGRTLKGLIDLVGEATALEIAPGPPEATVKLSQLDWNDSALKEFGGVQWTQKADDVGLLSVHRLAYSYLSGLAHGNLKSHEGMFHKVGEVHVAHMPQRSAQLETRWGIWAWWFQTRVLAICAAELGADFEKYSDDALQARPKSFEATVIQKEHIRGPARGPV